jgi:hypothetical protein
VNRWFDRQTVFFQKSKDGRSAIVQPPSDLMFTGGKMQENTVPFDGHQGEEVGTVAP